MRWEPTGASCGGAPSGTTITGTLRDGTYTNSYSLTLDKNPDAFTLTPITGQAVSTTATSNTITLAGTNAPSTINYAAGSPDTLTNVKVSVNGGAFVSMPTTADPGQTLQFQGDVGSGQGVAYTATMSAGTTTSSWSVTTDSVACETNPKIFTSDGTWTACPASTNIFVTVVGGGGGSFGVGVSQGGGAAGGGGGGSASGFVTVTPGTTYTITVGQGAQSYGNATVGIVGPGGTSSAFGLTATGGDAGSNTGAGGSGSGGSDNRDGTYGTPFNQGVGSNDAGYSGGFGNGGSASYPTTFVGGGYGKGGDAYANGPNVGIPGASGVVVVSY
jgi:hypothetical protein